MSKAPPFYPATTERAVISSVRNAPWITDADKATVWGARYTARQIDNIDKQGRLDGIAAVDPMMGELARTLLSYLRDLGLTPGARRRLGIGEEVDDTLGATITRLRKAAAGSDAE